MPVEKGLRLGARTLADLKKAGALAAALEDFDRFYIGAEFCENLLDKGVCAEAGALLRRGRKVCLLTPPLSEKGVRVLDKIFAGLPRPPRGAAPDALEITVNDFGAVELARRRRLPFRLNAGRLLRDNLFDNTGKPLKVHNGEALAFWRELGITRFELSTIGALPEVNFSDGKRYGFAKDDFRLTLYYPYLDLTSARACPLGMPDVKPGEAPRGVACARECRVAAFELAHPLIKEKLLVRGNTVFLEFPGKFYSSEKDLEKMNVDRLVYEPYP